MQEPTVSVGLRSPLLTACAWTLLASCRHLLGHSVVCSRALLHMNCAVQWVEELFSGVPGGRGPRPLYGAAGPPFDGGRLYVLPAVRDEHRLTATFQLPCLNGKYRCAGSGLARLGACPRKRLPDRRLTNVSVAVRARGRASF
jgi:hypothetical protein